MAKTRSELVEKAVKKIGNFHARGKTLLGKPAHKTAFGTHFVASEAKRNGTNEDTLRKARQFAELYTPQELDELCDRCRKEQLTMGVEEPVFGPTHVIRLLSVPSKRRRQALQRAAIQGAWSTARLEAEIAKQFGRRRKGGRRRRVPQERADLLTQLERMCETWRRWYAVVSSTEDAEQTDRLDGLPDELRSQIARISRAVAGLQAAVAMALDQERS